MPFMLDTFLYNILLYLPLSCNSFALFHYYRFTCPSVIMPFTFLFMNLLLLLSYKILPSTCSLCFLLVAVAT
uniref:Uncharacterized protein n=1 Tax=Anopheles darlingi TaxID=43151 RepID=A0A2M4D8K6_ANODA